MVTIGFQRQTHPKKRPETDAERIGREEAIIAKAEADIDAGLGIGDDDLEAWLDDLDNNPDAPPPSPQSGPAPR